MACGQDPVQRYGKGTPCPEAMLEWLPAGAAIRCPPRLPGPDTTRGLASTGLVGFTELFDFAALKA